MNRSSAAVLSLILARILYTVNWFNIASIFYFIASEFKQDVSMLGLVTATFLVGVGLFQIPAGIFAAKHSTRKIAIYGILIASFAALVTGLSANSIQMAILRFIVGIGMACFFGPSVILISKYIGKGSEGLGIGLLNSAHAIGGILGLFGWVVLAEALGWRVSLAVSGGLGLISGLTLSLALLKEDNNEFTNYRIKMHDIIKNIFNKSLVILGITLLGFQAGASLILTFAVIYFVHNLGLDPVTASLIGSLSLITALGSSPLFGKVYDTIRDAKKILFVSGIASGLSFVGIASSSLYVIILSIILAGFFLSAGFVIVYAKAKEINRLQPQYQTLAVGFVNGISLFGAFWIPILFSFIVNRWGFGTAWLVGGIIVGLLVLPVIKLTSPVGKYEEKT
jgi:MFS family permease